jgi:hypothetical protein
VSVADVRTRGAQRPRHRGRRWTGAQTPTGGHKRGERTGRGARTVKQSTLVSPLVSCRAFLLARFPFPSPVSVLAQLADRCAADGQATRPTATESRSQTGSRQSGQSTRTPPCMTPALCLLLCVCCRCVRVCPLLLRLAVALLCLCSLRLTNASLGRTRTNRNARGEKTRNNGTEGMGTRTKTLADAEARA